MIGIYVGIYCKVMFGILKKNPDPKLGLIFNCEY